MPSPCSGTLHAHQRPLANFARCERRPLIPRLPLSHPRCHARSQPCVVAAPPCVAPRCESTSARRLAFFRRVAPLRFVPGLGAARVRVPRFSACLFASGLLPHVHRFASYWLLLRRGFRLPPRGFCLAFVFPSVPAGRSDPLASEARGGGRLRATHHCPSARVRLVTPHPSSPTEVSACLACCGSSCLSPRAVSRRSVRRALARSPPPFLRVRSCPVSFEMRSPATPAHALRSLLVPALLLARGACSSSGCTSSLLRRPAFCFQDTPFCYAFGDAFRQLPQRLFARRGRCPVVPLSIPCLAVLGRGVPAGCARQHSCGSQVPARALCRVACSHGASTSPAYTAHAAGVVLSARPSHAAPTTAVLPPVHLRSPPPRDARAGRRWLRCWPASLGTHTHGGGGRPCHSAVRGTARRPFAWRERKAARRCLGTVARAFAQGSARDRGGFRWPEGGARRMLQAALSQHRDAWRTTHTRNCVTEDARERQVRGAENAEGVQCAPRHASPARSAVRTQRTARGSGLAARRRMPRTREQR
ncbi:hypothetical protein ERJ75_000639800 [Trypanosoma vivax]|nr:hypothetical protein ERJ75_000639800 [Trypanosoma vivax]